MAITPTRPRKKSWQKIVTENTESEEDGDLKSEDESEEGATEENAETSDENGELESTEEGSNNGDELIDSESDTLEKVDEEGAQDKKIKGRKAAQESVEEVPADEIEIEATLESDDQENAENEKEVKDEDSLEKDSKDGVDQEENSLAKSENDAQNSDESNIEVELSKAVDEAQAEQMAAVSEFLTIIKDFCSFSIDEDEDNPLSQKLKELLEKLEELLAYMPSAPHFGEMSIIDSEKMKQFFDKYSDIIKDFVDVQSRFLQENLLLKKNELMQQVSEIALHISSKLPERDEIADGLRKAALKVAYHSSKLSITGKLKMVVKEFNFAPAIVKVAKSFINVFKVIVNPKSINGKILKNYLNALTVNISNLGAIHGKKNILTKDVSAKYSNKAPLAILAPETLNASRVISALTLKIENRRDPKDLKRDSNHKHAHHVKEIMESRKMAKKEKGRCI